MTLPLETRRASRNRMIVWFIHDLLIATALVVLTVQMIRALPFIVGSIGQ
jgi:hypothetical protein